MFIGLYKAMVTRFASISTRKLPRAMKIVSNDKGTVATSDYDDFHRMAKRFMMSTLLSANAQVLLFFFPKYSIQFLI